MTNTQIKPVNCTAIAGFIALFLLPVVTQAQQTAYTKTPAVGVHLVFFDFKGADSLHAFGRSLQPGIALHYQNSFNARFEYTGTLAGAFMTLSNEKNNASTNDKQLLLETDFSVRAKWFKTSKVVSPYVLAGAGFTSYNNQYGIFAPAGLGCQVNITPDLFLLINTQYRIPITTSEQAHFYHGIGIAGTITRKKVTVVKQVPIPAPIVRKQPPPIDTDGDGIVDSVDACPTIIGVARYHGCPPPPDTTTRPASQKQPNTQEHLVQQINRVATQLFFETGSYRLLHTSDTALNELITILKNNPKLHIAIAGHTDNTGTPESNLLLSENRAITVMNYLIKGGIDASRLQSKGYGQQQPVASNSTPEGRASNRRVEITVDGLH